MYCCLFVENSPRKGANTSKVLQELAETLLCLWRMLETNTYSIVPHGSVPWFNGVYTKVGTQVFKVEQQ